MQLLLSSALRHAEDLFGNQEAVVCGRKRLTYREFGARSRRLAAGLCRLGVRRGDRVATLLPNCHRYLEAYAAIPGLGSIIVPLNTRHTVREHRAVLADCGARLLLLDGARRNLAADLAGAVNSVVIVPDDYERLVAANTPMAFDDGADADDLAAIFYTGGTTGPAKGVMLSHRNLVLNAWQMIVGAGYDERDVFLHAAPMFHLADASSIYALTWRGARQVILPTFDPDAVLAQIARERVTCTILVPTMIAALLDRPALATTDRRSLRLILHGGAPIAADLLRRAIAAFGCSFMQAYGLTEASSHVALLPREEELLDDPRGRSTGRATLAVDLRIRRPDGAVCDPGEVGEVTVGGATVTRGYWNNPEATASAIRDGWFWTGDLGRLDDEGYVYLVDRAKDVIISGGENIYPREVEALLETHPAVATAAVIGVPDPTWGERVHAVVALRPGQRADPATLQAHCKARLAGYKCPRSVEFVDALPVSGAGKVSKRALRPRDRPPDQRQEP